MEQHFKNGNKKSEASFKNGLNEDHYISYHENGNRRYESHYGEHLGNYYDGKSKVNGISMMKMGKARTVKLPTKMEPEPKQIISHRY